MDITTWIAFIVANWMIILVVFIVFALIGYGLGKLIWKS
jgi:hypothetical protein